MKTYEKGIPIVIAFDDGIEGAYLMTILRTYIESEYAIEDVKKFAQKLLELIKKSPEIMFPE